MQSKVAILQSACNHFGRFGFRGASLRDIARDAGVSLPLLNHHFGGKKQLLAAVVDTQRGMLSDRVAALRRLTSADTSVFTPSDLVRAWIRGGFEIAATHDGEMFLRLQLRVIDEPAEEGLVIACDAFDDAEALFIDALHRCYPHATSHAVDSTYVFVNGSFLKYLTAAQRRFRFVQADKPEVAASEDAMRLTVFLVAGIDAVLGAMGGTHLADARPPS